LLGNGVGILISAITVSKTASGESGQNDGGLVRGKGIGTFAEARERADEAGQKIPARGYARFAGQRPVRQRSLFADLIFGYFVSRQSNSTPAAIERAILIAPRYITYLLLVEDFSSYLVRMNMMARIS